jgi:hypothetical protein
MSATVLADTRILGDAGCIVNPIPERDEIVRGLGIVAGQLVANAMSSR